MFHPHEIEEREYRFGPKLWDADPDVCCAAFQLGACVHTEGYHGEYTDDPEIVLSDEDDEREFGQFVFGDVCREDGCLNPLDDGEGWDGRCGPCADRHDQEYPF